MCIGRSGIAGTIAQSDAEGKRAAAVRATAARVDPRIIEGAMVARQTVTQGVDPGALTWPALLRKLDHLDPSYKD